MKLRKKIIAIMLPTTLGLLLFQNCSRTSQDSKIENGEFTSRADALSAPTTDLGATAAILQPGQWAKLSTIGAEVIGQPNYGNLLEYANKAGWDPIHRRMYFCGGSHHDYPGGEFHNDCIQYDEATNTFSSIWSNLSELGYCKFPCPSDWSKGGAFVHDWDGNATDTLRGDHYFRGYNRLLKYNGTSGKWSNTSLWPNGQGCLDRPSIVYNPDIDRVMVMGARCDGEAFYYDPATDSWSNPQSPTNSFGNGEIHTLSAYSSQGYVYMGCGNGSNEMWQADSSLIWRQVATLPTGCAIPYTLLVADPGSGNLLHFAGNIFELNPNTNTWGDTGVTAICPASGDCSAVVVPIPDHNVIMLIRGFAASYYEVWIYKHSPGTGKPPPVDSVAPTVTIVSPTNGETVNR
jgi:hypothetical protein